jgi:rubrerythrin
MMSKAQERTQEAVELLRSWQALEREAIETTAEIMEQTDNLLIRQIMEIIRNDSVQHHRVQQFLIDMMTRQPVHMSPGDMSEVWSRLEEHDELERRTIEMAKELKEKTTDVVAKVLLEYLIIDEQKHDTLLGQLEAVKRHLSKLA